MAILLKVIRITKPPTLYNDVITNGPIIVPQKRIKLYDDTEWEQFIEECAHSLKNDYKDVLHAGSAGDQGIDIAAFRSDNGFLGKWDNYQCKHYNHALYPSDAYLELGKLCYYTYIKEYTIPEYYYFVAPQGIGTKLGKLIRGNPDELKRLLINGWKDNCENNITSKNKVLLVDKFKDYVESFDFSIVKDISILKLLDIHRDTPYYHHRFGGGLPSRPSVAQPPEEIAEIEAVYIQKLFDAYAEFLQKDQCGMPDVDMNAALKKHLRNARIHFYCAESLQNFSRGYLENGEFERLQDTIYMGIENIILNEHSSGYERVKSAVQEAYKIQIDSHPLRDRLDLMDRAGICHQLANNNRLSWANRDQGNE
ncbi:MAG: ABC-three component system protein [Chlorobiaceae bacterium]